MESYASLLLFIYLLFELVIWSKCIRFSHLCLDELEEDCQDVKLSTTHLFSLKCTHVSLARHIYYVI
ncbi:hypothetical protein GIB67_031421, partial [Kingdonia uniflora]